MKPINGQDTRNKVRYELEPHMSTRHFNNSNSVHEDIAHQCNQLLLAKL